MCQYQCHFGGKKSQKENQQGTFHGPAGQQTSEYLITRVWPAVQ